MAGRYVAPATASVSFNCPICGALAHQTWYRVLAVRMKDGETPILHTDPDSVFPNLPKDVPAETRETLREYARRLCSGVPFIEEGEDTWSKGNVENLHISRCYSCDEISIWRHNTLLYPHARYEVEPNPDLPVDIRADFDEARAVLNVSPRGAAALLRLCIQKICVHLGKSNNVNNAIAEMVAAGLDPGVQMALDVVRVVGNECVHPGTMDMKDDRGTAEKLFVLVNRIAYDMITHPRELADLYDKLPLEKQKQIEERDAKALAKN